MTMEEQQALYYRLQATFDDAVREPIMIKGKDEPCVNFVGLTQSEADLILYCLFEAVIV